MIWAVESAGIEESTEKTLARAKSSLGSIQGGIGYDIQHCTNCPVSGEKLEVPAAAVDWMDWREGSPDLLLRPERGAVQSQTRATEAEDFILRSLREGMTDRKKIVAQGEAEGFGERRLRATFTRLRESRPPKIVMKRTGQAVSWHIADLYSRADLDG